MQAVRVLHVLQPGAPAPLEWRRATLLNWTIKRNQPVSWSSELPTSCVVRGSRSTPLSRLVTSKRESSTPQKNGVPIYSTFASLDEFHGHVAQLGKSSPQLQQRPPTVKIDLHGSPHGDPSGTR